MSGSSRWVSVASVSALALALAACSTGGDPVPGSAAYKAGALGNGGFTFSCADTNQTCLAQTTGDAKAFPAGVAKGSTFRVRYVPAPSVKAAVNVEIDETSGAASAGASGSNRGSLDTVGGQFLERGSGGFFAKNAGIGTVLARDPSGALIEFTTIPIREAKRLLVYEAATATNAPSGPSVLSTTMKVNDQRSFRVIAQDVTQQNLGGSFVTTWSSDDKTVADVESQDKAIVNVVARKAGTTKLTVKGVELTTEINVEVTP